jgi:hypothetical protein
MKIRTLWGFEGDASKLGAQSGRIRAGETFDDVDKDYAHGLIGNGLAIEVDASAAPKETKPAAAAEKKAAADKAAADKAAADKLAADKAAADKAASDKAAADKAAADKAKGEAQ